MSYPSLLAELANVRTVAGDGGSLSFVSQDCMTDSQEQIPTETTVLVRPDVALRLASAILRRRWITLLVTVVAVVGVTIALSLRETKEYQANALVYLSQQNLANEVSGISQQGSDSLTLARLDQTQAAIADTPQVAAEALSRGHVTSLTAKSLLAETQITPNSNADLLEFAVTDVSPARAVQLANGLAHSYTTYRLQLDTASLSLALAQLRRQIADLVARHQTSSPLYSTLAGKNESLQSIQALETSNAQVVQAATSAVKVKPRTTRNTILALVIGLVIGGVLMLGREAIDSRLRTEDDIAEVLRLPLLARLSPPKDSEDGTISMLTDASGPAAEEFRLLRANLELAAISVAECRTILVVSAQEAEGKSTTITNLAVTWARLGKRVALVDLDLRRPRLASLVKGDAPAGITDVVRGDSTLADAFVDIAIPNPGADLDRDASTVGVLNLLSTGIPPYNIGEFLALDRVHRILEQLRDEYDMVLVDSPPLTQFADALTIAPAADALLVVARLNAVTRPAARELHRTLSMGRTPLLGFVLTGSVNDRSAYRYSYGYPERPEAGNDSRSRRPADTV